mmetsp:Transcript_33640/g.92174  ORF Transcript_33640/g.92174 Transcript_33640/m.92174 type:complete len:244 (-) Transcript_33640:4632-5363(-)
MKESSSTPVGMSQRAPSMNKPVTYAPSRADPSISSTFIFFVTSTVVTSLLSAQSFLRDVTCLIALTKACALKRPETHVTLGNARSPVQLESCSCRASRLASQPVRESREAHASFSHDIGVLSPASASMSFSMGSVIERSPLRPISSSMSERLISKSKLFMRSHSCRKTPVYGVTTSMRSWISSIEKSSGIFSRMSSSSNLTLSPTVAPPPPPPPPLGERLFTSEKSEVACWVMKLISALGCKP